MKKIVNTKLYAGLVASFCVIILFSVILTAVGAITIKRVRDNYDYTVSMPEIKIRLLKDIKTDFMIMRYRVANYVMNSGDEEYINGTASRQYDTSMQTLMQHLDDYIVLNMDDNRQDADSAEENISNAENFKDLISQYTVFADEVKTFSLLGDAQEADNVLKSAISIAETSLELLDEMIYDSEKDIQQVSIDVNIKASGSIIFLLSLSFVLVILAVALSFFVVRATKSYIAHLREAELAAEESSHMKSVFLANMSHEIRTPLNGIIGFSELSLDDSLSPRTKDYLEKIKYSSEGLLQIINDVLDISKIEAGKMELEIIPFSIQELFRVCQAIIAPKALEKGVTLFCYAEPSVGKKLLGDPTKLRQVLLNLLSNAVKFTNVGIVKLLSNVNEESEDSVTMHFEVKDSGIGLTPEQVNRIFDPFMQADNGTTRKYGGTGLGLPITKNIIDMMGGDLAVESTPGIGSKFSFDLTFKTINIPAETREVTIEKLEKPSFSGEVLICEDNRLNQQVICEHLSRVGLKSIVAINGKEGVDYVRERNNKGEPPFDLIFMDIHMPVMDGLEASAELEKAGNKTPVVALTANVMPTDKETYRQFGMPDCLSKPFTAQELWICLLKYLKPINLEAGDIKEQSETDKKLQEQILSNFFHDNQTTYRDISDAAKAEDIKLAHRLAHTLKSTAGLIGKTTLQEAAETIERSLANESPHVTDDQMQVLAFELDTVLAELGEVYGVSKPSKPSQENIDINKSLALLDVLEPLLKSGDTDCLDMTDDLAAFKGTDILISQIDAFNFAQAIITLNEIKLDLVREKNGKKI